MARFGVFDRWRQLISASVARHCLAANRKGTQTFRGEHSPTPQSPPGRKLLELSCWRFFHRFWLQASSLYEFRFESFFVRTNCTATMCGMRIASLKKTEVTMVDNNAIVSRLNTLSALQYNLVLFQSCFVFITIIAIARIVLWMEWIKWNYMLMRQSVAYSLIFNCRIMLLNTTFIALPDFLLCPFCTYWLYALCLCLYLFCVCFLIILCYTNYCVAIIAFV